jgi:ribosomal protein L15E
MIDATDPLAPLEGLPLSAAAEEAVGRLLVVERLLASGKASHIERFALGPAHLGERRVELIYVDRQRYSNVEPAVRRIEGVRRAA